MNTQRKKTGGTKRTPHLDKHSPKEDGSYSGILRRCNDIFEQYAGAIPADAFYSAFSRAGWNMANQPQIQNSRIKGISTLPQEYSKAMIGEFLRCPYISEQPLRAVSETLRWTAYPYFKIGKTYQDIPTYRYYARPMYLSSEEVQNPQFMREAVLVDKLNKRICPEKTAHKITGQAVMQGKVFYVPRVGIDKAHNTVKYAFLQQLPTDWCTIIGYNNISGYTVSFNMMYFTQPGTDWRQFGDLFKPYLEDFGNIFEERNEKRVVYAKNDNVIKCGNKTLRINTDAVKANAKGNPNVYRQDGRWFYYVSLPVDKVWTFEIDDTTPTVAPPLSGLMLTYSQQSDYEAAQLSLLLNPLIKIFTGEIPYFNDAVSKEDGFKLSLGGRALFESFFTQLMQSSNTSGTAFFTAPVQNIRSHDFSESANANKVSESFIQYSLEKAGLAGLLPATADVKSSQVAASMKIEGRFPTSAIYPQFERMMNCIYESLSLRYEWNFKMFGTIFTEEGLEKTFRADLDRGDTSAYMKLSALSGESWIDKLSMMMTVSGSGLTSLLSVPQTSFTQSGDAGRPETEGISSDAKEKQKDSE